MDEALKQSVRRFLDDAERREAALISSGYQGSAYRFDHDGRPLVIKESGGGFLTGWFHRRMLSREARVYALLQNVRGVPHSPGFIDDRWLLLEFVEGPSFKAVRKTMANRDEFLDGLRKVITAFHAAGVAHGDLKRKDNILVGEGGRPFVIDFGTAVTRDGSLLDRLLFATVMRIDRNSWIKAKYRFEVDAIDPADRDWYQPTFAERGFRQLRRFWRTITFRQARNRRKKLKAAGDE